jgi:hypothetical protein
MNAADIKARVQRLDQLCLGLAREISIVDKADDPMLYLERRAYPNALLATVRGVETARVALVKAKQRIDRGGREPS